MNTKEVYDKDIMSHSQYGKLNETESLETTRLTIETNSEYFSFLEKGTKSLKNTWVRWLALLMMCFGNFGPYFCFDNPQPLQSYLEAALNISATEYNLLYTLYSLPNIFLALAGGLVTDFFGNRLAIIFFSSMTILGQVVTTIAAANSSFAGLLAGRLLFGIGEESLVVSLNTIIAKWFKGKEIAFAFGLNLTITRLGSSLNTFMTPRIYSWANNTLYIPFLFGVILNVGSWCCCLFLSYLDKKADAIENSQSPERQTKKVNFSDLKSLPLLYFLLLINCGLLYGSYFGLMDNLNDMMTTRFGYTIDSAGTFILIVYLSSAAFNPLFGLYFDKVGKRVFWMLVAVIIFLVTQFTITFLNDGTSGPNYGMVGGLFGIGLFISVFSPVFWPCISLAVDKKVTGTAYGLVGCMVNLAIATVPLIAGAIHDKTQSRHEGYFWSQIFLSGAVIVSIFVTLRIYVEDKNKGGALDKIQEREH